VNVTLYGASGETYKSLCGDETGYAKAMRGIRLLQAHGVPVKVGVSVVRQNRHDLGTLFQITKEQDLELEPDTYMMSTESGQHEARLSPEEAAAASLAATRIKLGTVGFHEYAQCTVQALESAVPETEAGMRCLAGRCSFAVGWRGDLRPCVMLGALSVPIEHNDVQAAVDLSADGSNRIDLRGGGNLTYTMNPLGDVRLSGKYVLSGGSVRYNPPVISQKIFKITPDSYVEWIGDIADPAFNITAVETVRANVSSDGQDSRPVNFDISINIRNSLNDLAISFGLAAPEDLAMQNQLNSLTAEQRANQAMNLLIYNTYTGPGTTAKVSSENPLNTFIQKELNQWAQNNLKGVDLSFGIDSHGEDDPNGQRTDYSYRLSKNLFNNRVRAVIGGKFSTDADPSQNLKENLIDDISLEYMLTKRDNMYLKVFRHTGYESILEGEITETGVGFVIRKKLSRLGDLFKPMRPKTKKPKK